MSVDLFVVAIINLIDDAAVVVNNAKPKQPGRKRKPLLPIEDLTIKAVKNRRVFGTQRLYDHLLHFSKILPAHWSVTIARPSDYEGRLHSMVDLLKRYNGDTDSDGDGQS